MGDKELTVSQQSEIMPVIDMKTITDYMDAQGLTSSLEPKEKTMFINIAKEYGLNPFKREIYCTAYGQGQYRKCAIVTGYEVYIKRAERTGKLDGWNVKVEGHVNDKTLSATVIIHRKDWQHPFEHTAYYLECVQTTKDKQTGAEIPNSVWKKQPIFMTKKVAIAQGFRLCFSDEFGGMPYTNDELGVEPVAERNITPVEETKVVEEPSKAEIESELDTDRTKLAHILETYEKDLSGQPYELSCRAMADGDPEKISEMLGRCITYLGRKGIKVA